MAAHNVRHPETSSLGLSALHCAKKQNVAKRFLSLFDIARWLAKYP